MFEDVVRVLLIDAGAEPLPLDMLALGASGFGPFAVEACTGLAQAGGVLGGHSFDAVLVGVADGDAALRLPHWPGLSQATPDAAVVVWLAAPCDADLAKRLVQAGVQDVIAPSLQDHGCSAEVARSLRLAVERKRIERAARKACATDLQTGLPNRQQLIEHMSQLLALRGREPAPMALLVIRVEGFGTAEAALGREAANVLRRKVAVRLRASVRASDVVAALSQDGFALLLASTEAPLDAERVARKVLKALHPPFAIAGQQVGIAASVGLACYPADGDDAAVLMRQAVAAAAAAQASGRGGFVNWQESGWQDTSAANDG
ncbi:MAG: GGDEF domain-containing protein [Ideonella sp.]|nr:GGDEF domain-containing protein [Ideonella sp.]